VGKVKPEGPGSGDLQGRSHLGRYQLVRRLAVGGMGEVWLARPVGGAGVEPPVVLKTLLEHLKEDQDFVNMFFDEARIASALKHPNIARIAELGEDGGEYFIAMEYVRGPPLTEVVQRARARGMGLPLALACRIVAEAAGALDFAHAAKTAEGLPLGVIHRDVSPQNILLGVDGAVKLIDFGVAKAANKLVRTATGTIRGKHAYMSPEQAYGKRLDARSDVFGLGIVLWELLAGARLFKRESELETLRAVVGAKLRPPSAEARAVPRSLDAIVRRALEREVDARYQTAGALKEDLEGFLERQRLPASAAHLAAWLQLLYPTGVEDEPGAGVASEPTHTSVSALPVVEPARPRTRRERGPGDDELERRIGVAQSGLARGLFFNAVLNAVLRGAGAAAEAKVRRAALEPRPWIDALEYPTAELLRLLGRAADLLAKVRGSAELALAELGTAMAQALLRTPVGRVLEARRSGGPVPVVQALLEALASLLAPGTRSLHLSEGQTMTLVMSGDALPPLLLAALVREVGRAVLGVELEVRRLKESGERIELTLGW
jgi:serine/threonine-protein kinase